MGIETAIIALAATSAVMGAAGGIWGGVTSYMQGNSQSDMSNYNAAVARNQAIAMQNQSEYNAEVMRNNQIAAEQDAEATERDSRLREQKQREENQRFLDMQRGKIAKSGLMLEGSPLAVMGESAGNLEMDALEIRRQGVIDANEYRRKANAFGSEVTSQDYQSEIYGYQGNLAYDKFKTEGSYAKKAGTYGLMGGMVNGAGSLLSGASSSMYMNEMYKMKKSPSGSGNYSFGAF